MRDGDKDGGEVKYMTENRLRHAHFNSPNTYLLCTYCIPGAVLGIGDITLNKTDNILVLVGLHSNRKNLKYKY